LELRAEQELNEMLRPLEGNEETDGVTAVLRGELRKGFRNGILFARNLPDFVVESLELDRTFLQEMIKEKEEENHE
jgi:hypothetical protein